MTDKIRTIQTPTGRLSFEPLFKPVEPSDKTRWSACAKIPKETLAEMESLNWVPIRAVDLAALEERVLAHVAGSLHQSWDDIYGVTGQYPNVTAEEPWPLKKEESMPLRIKRHKLQHLVRAYLRDASDNKRAYTLCAGLKVLPNADEEYLVTATGVAWDRKCEQVVLAIMAGSSARRETSDSDFTGDRGDEAAPTAGRPKLTLEAVASITESLYQNHKKVWKEAETELHDGFAKLKADALAEGFSEHLLDAVMNATTNKLIGDAFEKFFGKRGAADGPNVGDRGELKR